MELSESAHDARVASITSTSRGPGAQAVFFFKRAEPKIFRFSQARTKFFILARSRTRESDVEFTNQSERCVFRKPRAGARGHLPARAPGDACGEAMRVYPGRGAPRFASGRRRGAGEVARRGVCVTFLAHGYSCATRAVFLTRQTRARRRALTTRGARAGRSARGVRRVASIATFAAIIRVDIARRARRIPSRRWA